MSPGPLVVDQNTITSMSFYRIFVLLLHFGVCLTGLLLVYYSLQFCVSMVHVYFHVFFIFLFLCSFSFVYCLFSKEGKKERTWAWVGEE